MVKRSKALLLLTIVPMLLIVGFVYGYFHYFGPQTVMQTNRDSSYCRQGNIFNGVDRQARFSVISTCETVTGVIHDMKKTKEDDGDYQFNLVVNSQYKRLLNLENDKRVNGMLVMEIIPKDQNSTSIQIPKNGDRIEASGALVTDNPHGWNEIHPVWKLKVL